MEYELQVLIDLNMYTIELSKQGNEVNYNHRNRVELKLKFNYKNDKVCMNEVSCF